MQATVYVVGRGELPSGVGMDKLFVLGDAVDRWSYRKVRPEDEGLNRWTTYNVVRKQGEQWRVRIGFDLLRGRRIFRERCDRIYIL